MNVWIQAVERGYVVTVNMDDTKRRTYGVTTLKEALDIVRSEFVAKMGMGVVG